MSKLVTADIVLVKRSCGLLASIPRDGEWITVYWLAERLKAMGYRFAGEVGTVTFEATAAGTKPNDNYDNPFIVADKYVIPEVRPKRSIREIDKTLRKLDIDFFESKLIGPRPGVYCKDISL
jgi:hypothetical protein